MRRNLFLLVSASSAAALLVLLLVATTADFSEDALPTTLAQQVVAAAVALKQPAAPVAPAAPKKVYQNPGVVSKSEKPLALGEVWTYSGSTGPKSWGGKCSSGVRQSPIDVNTDQVIYNYKLAQPDWEYDQGRKDVEVLFNGHTVKVSGNYATLSFARHEWHLKYYHLHTPSEHKINGVSFPVEMQMVHRSASGRTLIVSWFFDTDEFSPAYVPELADDFPATSDGSAEYNHPVPGPNQVEFNQFVELLVQRERKGHMFYTYEGSMTSPPCTEGVTWVVMTEMVGIAENDVKKLKRIEGKNNRPVQPVNGRKVFKSFAAS